jgi:hypothetical protein
MVFRIIGKICFVGIFFLENRAIFRIQPKLLKKTCPIAENTI